MKNKKGFTLIELLAVIVILAIIALIATPIVLNIIKDSKDSATLQSAQFYMDAVETAVAQKIIDDQAFRPETCDIQADGNLLCEGKEVVVEIKGEKPTSGTIILKQGKITEVTLELSEKTITKNTEGKLVYGEPEVQLESGLYDAEGNLIASWDELVNVYGIDLEKDVEPEFDENDEIINLLEFPGIILSNDTKLKQGTKLVIDSSVTEIGVTALALNTTLEEIIIPNSVIKIGDTAFYGCTSLTEATISNSVTSIGESAFDGCTSLTEIIIPNSVTSIGRFAFQGCTSLEKVIMGNSVTSIEGHAFAYCTSLTEINIPNSVTSIAEYTFGECTSLSEITIPKGITEIRKEAFYGCTSLKTINYTGTEVEWNSINKSNADIPSDATIIYNYGVQ